MQAETFTLQVADQTFTCRRPTHGELDLRMLERLIGVYCGYQRRIVETEEGGEQGASVQIARYVEIASDAARELRERILRAAKVIAPDLAGWLDVAEEIEATRRGLETAAQLLEVLMPVGLVPK